MRWKLSFDKYSRFRREPVLNIARTNREEDAYYTTVFEVDEKVFDALLRREMGETNTERFKQGDAIPYESHRPVSLDSRYGPTVIFLIPPEGTKRSSTTWNAEYVRIVKKGIEESYRGKMLQTNLQALRRAVEESQED